MAANTGLLQTPVHEPPATAGGGGVALANDYTTHLQRLLDALVQAQANRDYRSATAVTHFQIALAELGVANGLSPTGRYDKATTDAVTRYQTNHPPLAADGDLGFSTLEQMIKDVQALQQAQPGAPAAAAASITQRLDAYYSVRSNYQSVYRDVMSWFGMTTNGCAAFLSTALRHIAIPVPHAQGPNGYNISTIAQSLAEWLIANGWTKYTAANSLQPGDVVVTQDDPQFPGFAAHIFMFSGWQDQAQLTCVAIDNQGFQYQRNIGSGQKTPMHYFLRA